jgi:DNA polymerase III subunit delta'
MSWKIIGQEKAVTLLRRAVEDETRLSHAYLFLGPEHVGRATTARAFAQALNCQATSERPCGECRSCRLIDEGKHPDVETLAPGGVCEEPEHKDHEGSRDIRICQVRRLERVVSRAPFEARYRVVIVDPAESMTSEAANAFLKTLEEPPQNVVLVLIVALPERVPETVRSRCRQVTFYGVPREETERALVETWGATPDLAGRVARLAQGRTGWAVAAVEDEKVLVERDRTLAEVRTSLQGGISERFAYAELLGRRFSQDAAGVDSTLALWEEWWRDALLAASQRDDLLADVQRLDEVRPHASQYGVGGALKSLMAVREARKRLEENASPTLALEAMLLEMPAGPSKRR